jgi:hypothetical protein
MFRNTASLAALVSSRAVEDPFHRRHRPELHICAPVGKGITEGDSVEPDAFEGLFADRRSIVCSHSACQISILSDSRTF